MLNILYPCIGTQETKRPNPGTSDSEPSVLYVILEAVPVIENFHSRENFQKYEP